MSNMSSSDQPIITYQTGENESYIIGTKEQILNFANTIIKAVENAEPTDFVGEEVLSTSFTTAILDSKGEVGIDEVFIVKDDDQKNDVFNRFCADK